MELDLEAIFELDVQKLITVRTHPDHNVDLYIANYTPQVQFDKLWGKHPLLPLCRGLIFDGTGHVIARPFSKFFNYGEYDGPLPTGPFEVTEKMDGSLGIVYPQGNGSFAVATRGSFASDQAIKGTEMLRALYGRYSAYDPLNQGPLFNRDYTYLFEIIYPANRIVVNYGDKEELVLLAVIDIETGRDVPRDEWYMEMREYFDVAPHYPDAAAVHELEVDPDKEGYVVRFLENDLRLKVKGAEYLRLHKVLTGVNARTIWQALNNGDNIEAWMMELPDEFCTYIRTTASKLQDDYDRKAAAVWRIYDRIMESFTGFAYPDRKQFAMEATKHPCASILFTIFDQKDWTKQVWKLVYPAADAPFKVEM